MEESRSVHEVVQDEILFNRTQRYRRNLIALSVVAIAIHGFDFVDFSKLNLFGLELQKGQDSEINPKTLALTVLWLLIAYNTTFGGYGAYWDWRQWVVNITNFRKEGAYFAEHKMFWGEGNNPTDKYIYTNPSFPRIDVDASWKYHEENKQGFWKCDVVYGNGLSPQHTFKLSIDTIRHVKEKTYYFYLTEIGIPIFLFIVAAITAIKDIF